MKLTIQKTALITILAGLIMPFAATAASLTVVTPSNTQGWSTADTRPGGASNFIVDTTAPSGFGALELTTDATTTAKAQFMRAANLALADVTELSYYAKQNSASFSGGNASYQLPVYLNGSTGFTTFVFEPYQNGTVVNNAWQSWDVDAGQFWSTRSVTCSNGSVVAGGGGAPFYTLSQIQTMCPNAQVLGFGVNIGSNNPSYNVEVDLVSLNGDVFDFEPTLTPQAKDSCKDNGWMVFNTPTFKNQGECIAYFNKNS